MTEKLIKYIKYLINMVIYNIQFALAKHHLLIADEYQ